MDFKNLLPPAYYDFIKQYEKPIEVEDKKTGTKWNIATLNDSSFCLENYASLIQELADEANDFYTDISNGQQVSKDFIKNFIVIGRHTDYFLCLNGEEIWQIVLDPGEIKKLASSLESWEVEIFTSELETNDNIRNQILGVWERSKDREYNFLSDGNCIRKIEEFDYEYEWTVKEKKGINYLWLYDKDYLEEEWCEIKKLTVDSLTFIYNGDTVNLTRIK